MNATLAAGRELDALVAEKVMGWTHIEFHPPRLAYGVHPKALRHADVPLYSDRIEYAWEVVEAMQARGWRVVIRTEAAISRGPRVEVSGLHPVRRAEWMVHDDAPTVPLAICRAALAAVEAQ